MVSLHEGKAGSVFKNENNGVTIEKLYVKKYELEFSFYKYKEQSVVNETKF